MEEIEKLVDKLEDNIRWWKRAFETDGFESNEEGSYRRELENTKKELYTSIQQELDKAREEVLIELQKEFSEFGVPDDVRYTQPLFYINEVIEKKLSKLKTKEDGK